MASSDRNREEEEDVVSMDWREIVGTKFNPTDEILADYYLRQKAAGRNDGIFKCIRNVDIYDHQPSELSSPAYDFGDGKKMMYFVTALKMINVKGTNVDRFTKDKIGFWKITGNISSVEKDGRKIASKTPLAYYENKMSDKPKKSKWLMKEYRLIEDQSNEESEKLALCVIYLCDTKSGKGVREEKNKQSSVSVMGERSNSKTIATVAASSPVPPTEDSNHQDTLEIPIPDSDQNMLEMEFIDSNYPYQNMPYLEMESPGSNFFQNILNQVMGSHGATATDSNLELPSDTLEIPIAYSDQNMLGMEFIGSNYPYQNMPYPEMEFIDSDYPYQNMPYPEMEFIYSDYPYQNMPYPEMEFIDSDYPYQNMPFPEMESPGSNFVQNIPNQVMGLHGAFEYQTQKRMRF